VTVFLVGAGPGDPELLTVRAAALIASADMLVHDRLISAAILDLAPPSVVRLDVSKRAGHAVMPQAEINQVLIDHGRAGRRVVRLKGGDPFVFGRGGEECEALLLAGVPFEVVPGISSAIAAPAAAGIPVTMRNQASAFTVVTGHVDPTGTSTVDWEAHAATGATLVILMGVGQIASIAKRLMAAGRPPATPVAVVHAATTSEQLVVRLTLADVGEADLVAPSTIIVGDVAGLDLRYSERRRR
jgi:uroporphyrin-III C-methyltransferase